MATTVLIQQRTISALAGQTFYDIVTAVQDQGDLPDNGIFLTRIVDTNDPSRDEFARITSINDLVNFERDRTLAVLSGQNFFRAASFTKQYTNVTVANTAKGLVDGYVNDLVVAYQEFTTDFSTIGFVGPPVDYDVINFPLVSDSLKETLIADYETIRGQRVAKDAEIVTKQAECDSLSDDLAKLNDDKAFLLTLQEALVGLENSLTTVQSSFRTFVDGGDLLVGDVRAGIVAYEVDVLSSDVVIPGATSAAYFRDPDPNVADEVDEGTVIKKVRVYDTNANTARAAVEDLGAKFTLVSQKKDNITGLITQKDGDINLKQAEQGTCAEELNTLNQEQAQLVIQEQTALDAVLAVCPDYEAV